MKDIIRDLVINGTDPQEIRAVLDKFEAEMAETAALAKEQEKEEARVTLMDALAKYYIAADILTEEEVKSVNWNHVMDSFLNMEQYLLKFKRALTDNHPSIKVKVSEAPKEGRDLNFIGWLGEIENMLRK
jgi:hypothetical protein